MWAGVAGDFGCAEWEPEGKEVKEGEEQVEKYPEEPEVAGAETAVVEQEDSAELEEVEQ